MPFKSKAQQRFMFATNPAKAKEWAKETPNIKALPEKKHPSVNPSGRKLDKSASDGMFFQKRAQPREGGHFFRDLPGRATGSFNKSANEMMGYDDQPAMPNMNMTPPPEPDPGEMGGGMYGTGEPPKEESKTQKETQRLLALLGTAGPGTTRSATKVASATPSDWENDASLPTGFHRPAKEQPESLETGGDRFFSTLAKSPESGSPPGIRHGVREGGSMQMGATSSPQMGKHAGVQFYGTSFDKLADGSDSSFTEEGAKRRFSEAGGTLRTLGQDITDKADEGIKTITKSPAAMGVAALLGGKLLMRGGRGLARGTARMFGRKPVPKPGIVAQGIGSLKRLIGR